MVWVADAELRQRIERNGAVFDAHRSSVEVEPEGDAAGVHRGSGGQLFDFHVEIGAGDVRIREVHAEGELGRGGRINADFHRIREHEAVSRCAIRNALQLLVHEVDCLREIEVEFVVTGDAVEMAEQRADGTEIELERIFESGKIWVLRRLKVSVRSRAELQHSFEAGTDAEVVHGLIEHRQISRERRVREDFARVCFHLPEQPENLRLHARVGERETHAGLRSRRSGKDIGHRDLHRRDALAEKVQREIRVESSGWSDGRNLRCQPIRDICGEDACAAFGRDILHADRRVHRAAFDAERAAVGKLDVEAKVRRFHREPKVEVGHGNKEARAVRLCAEGNRDVERPSDIRIHRRDREAARREVHTRREIELMRRRFMQRELPLKLVRGAVVSAAHIAKAERRQLRAHVR